MGHIGATRNHSSSLHNKQPKHKSLNVPGDTSNSDNDDQKTNANVKSKSNKDKTRQTTMNSMMSSSATNKRLEQLMAMRAGKDAKGNRSRSVNVSKRKEEKNKYPKKISKKVHKEPRRHSMIPDKDKNKDVHDKHLKDRRKTIELVSTMFNKLLHRKKKDKKHKDKLSKGSNLSKTSSLKSVHKKSDPNDVSIIHTESMLDDTMESMPSNPTKMSNSSQSQDDLSAEDIASKQRKFKRKHSQKRHSHIGATRNHSSSLHNKQPKHKSLNVP